MPDVGRYLTLDLGAESGRAILARLVQDKLTLTEIHRFSNEPQQILGRLYWDTPRLFAEIKKGLADSLKSEEVARCGLQGIGVDTWGVDYALLNAQDEVLGLPYHYRDHCTDGIMEQVFSSIARDEIYTMTGIQFLQFNTLFQLAALRYQNSPLLDQAHTLLFMPDLFNFWLTGQKVNEFTITSTSQCYNPNTESWAIPLLDRLGLPSHFLGEVVPPGTLLGTLHRTVSEEIGAHALPALPPVIATASHDTASAVAAVPVQASSAGWAYISCGTWSLVGIETQRPIINAQTLAWNLTNEGGIYGTYRLLRNVMGLWLLQCCRRTWERQGRRYDYEELSDLAAEAPSFAVLFDPDDPAFLNPPDMLEAMAAYCQRTGQTMPTAVGTVVRSIIESLALKYRWAIEKLEAVSEKPIETIHIIGGGSQNRLLCQATADCTDRVVLAGPVEATAAGNTLVQALATGRLTTLAEGRSLIGRSFPLIEYLPSASDRWQTPYERFTDLLQK